jgi:hypothetical protein
MGGISWQNAERGPWGEAVAKASKVALEDCFLPAIKTTTGKTTGMRAWSTPTTAA